MTNSTTARTSWSIAPEPVRSADAVALFRDYYTEVSDRYYLLHEGRRTTEEELTKGLAAETGTELEPPAGVLLIARAGGEAAGCAGIRLVDDRTAELSRVFVRPERRGLGGGSRLLAGAERTARERGAERIVLDTRHDLVEARALYARHGYAEVPAFNSRPYAERWFAKALTG